MPIHCAYHSDREPVGACVECGRLICVECKATLGGRMYCTPCADKKFVDKPPEPRAPQQPPVALPVSQPSHELAQPPAEAIEVAAARAGSSKRKRGLRGWQVALIIVVVIFGGGFLWFKWPDFPPRPLEAAWNNVTGVLHKDPEGPAIDPQLEKQIQAELAPDIRKRLSPEPGSPEERAARIKPQIDALRLPVDGVYVLPKDNGELVLSVALTSEQLISTSGGLSEVIGSFETLARAKTVNLSGLHDVDMAVQDKDGRILFHVSAPTSVIEQFRAGKATDRDLVRSMAFRGESRAAILDAAIELGAEWTK